MIVSTAWGICMLLVTTMVHTGAMLLVIKAVQAGNAHSNVRWMQIHLLRVAGVVILMGIASLVEALLWALLYVRLGAIEALEPAVYFSVVTYTTLGYGDITLNEQWRLLGAIQASNGIIMFGWTTAIVIAAIQRNYFGEVTENPNAP